MKEPLSERILFLLEAAAEEMELNRTRPTQEFADELRQLRQQLGLTVKEFSVKYGASVAEITTAELARGIKPSTKMQLLVCMIKSDPKKVAEIVKIARAQKK